MIEITGLLYAVKDRALLDGITLSIAEGETLGIIGPSGAGKSLLLKCMAGGIGGFAGRVTAAGGARGDIHLMPPPPENGADTLIEFVLSSRPSGLLGLRGHDAADRERASECLSWFELGPWATDELCELPGGTLRRAMLARVLAGEHAVTLIDNPTTGLDLRGQELLGQALVRHLMDGNRAVVMASNDINFIAQTCDRIIVLDRGKVVREGGPLIVDTDLVREIFGVGALVSRNIYNGRPQVHPFQEP